ncbi:hypothetical protein BCR43DRAFT_127883 [Syncephalastrum racemosum]|uniref:Uncharacterized protein n=1 Tax=Syncephalastrum racemosum TaxID=13706 RepID=A0A1X2HKZ0_SYNRA|nr:hypothetical protein BCR43DRAFT_127883 [Syncephalastrum racemosum]
MSPIFLFILLSNNAHSSYRGRKEDLRGTVFVCQSWQFCSSRMMLCKATYMNSNIFEKCMVQHRCTTYFRHLQISQVNM